MLVLVLELEPEVLVVVGDGVITDVTLTEQSSPANPLLQRHTPLASQLPCPEQFLGQRSTQFVPDTR